MDSELTIILKMIKQKTGLDIDAFSESLKFSASTRDIADLRLPTVGNVEDVFFDDNLQKTFFRFRFRNANLIGSIDGVGETQKNYAFLITTFLEGNSDREDDVGRGEQLKRIILGDYSRQQIQKFMHRFSVPDERCFILVVANEDGKTEPIMRFLSRFLSNEYDAIVLTDDMTCAFVKFVRGEQVNPVSFAESVALAVRSEYGAELNVGVSGVVNNLLEINNAYVQATGAIRMSRISNAKSGVHSYKDYMLVKILEDVPKFKLSEYLDALITPESKVLFRDSDMLATAESFLENDLNVSETARSLYMHRNTLIYRLDKIEKETGLDIKKFSDAVTFKLVAIMLKLLG